MQQQRIFTYRSHQILMDARKLAVWAQVTDEEKLQIWRSLRMVYTAWLAEVNAAEFKPTLEGITAELTKGIRPWDKLWDIARKLGDASVKEDVLELLKFSRYRHCNKSPLRDLFCRAVLFAANEGDTKFFKRLGRILEREAVPFHSPGEPTEIERALVTDWITDDGFCLCWCSDQAIADLLQATQYSCDFQAVRKARQRLGLRKPTLRLVTSIRRAGNDIIVA